MKRLIILLAAMLFAGGTLCADVIRLIDGKIYFGKIVGNEAGVSIIELGSEKKIVSQSDILKTESDISKLKSQPVDIHLKDGSILSGKIKDFDADVGVLLDIAFGSLTIPFQSIDYISDPVQRNYYNGANVKIGLTGGYYFAMGDTRASFNDNFNIGLFVEINPGLVRGFFTGISLSYLNVNFIPNADLAYLVLNAQVYLSYRFLQLRSSNSFLKPFVPYLSAGAGGAYVSTFDSRSGYSSSNRNEIDFSFSGTVGIDFFILDNLLIKVNGTWVSLVQSASLFNTLSVNVGAAFCF